MLSTRIDAGFGAGDQCDLCDQAIASNKVEYVVTDAHDGKPRHFHLACHLEWQRECAQRLRIGSDELRQPDLGGT